MKYLWSVLLFAALAESSNFTFKAGIGSCTLYSGTGATGVCYTFGSVSVQVTGFSGVHAFLTYYPHANCGTGGTNANVTQGSCTKFYQNYYFQVTGTSAEEASGPAAFQQIQNWLIPVIVISVIMLIAIVILLMRKKRARSYSSELDLQGTASSAENTPTDVEGH